MKNKHLACATCMLMIHANMKQSVSHVDDLAFYGTKYFQEQVIWKLRKILNDLSIKNLNYHKPMTKYKSVCCSLFLHYKKYRSILGIITC